MTVEQTSEHGSHKPSVDAQPIAIDSATHEFGMRPSVSRLRRRNFRSLVPPGARGYPLTNERVRRLASTTQIPAVRAEKIVQAKGAGKA